MSSKTASIASFQRRLTAFQTQLKLGEAALISKPNDIFYFTLFPQLAPNEREAFLLVSAKQTTLFHHSFSPTLPKTNSLTSVPKTDLTVVGNAITDLKVKQLLIDEDTLSVREYFHLKKLVSCSIKPLNPQWVWRQRTIKDAAELALMKQAGKIATTVFKQIIEELQSGVTERQVARRIATLLMEHGADEPAFPIIVAFGPHGALPHYQPTENKLKPETPVLIDFGARYQHYLSDMTRSFWFGKKPSARFQQVEHIVKTAYQKTLDQLATRPLTAKNLDDTARQYITKQGFGDQFIHTTGHGLGIEIHEPPSLSWQNNAVIQPGTTITIEPGIYLPGEFGYRHENTIVINPKSITILTEL